MRVLTRFTKQFAYVSNQFYNIKSYSYYFISIPFISFSCRLSVFFIKILLWILTDIILNQQKSIYNEKGIIHHDSDPDVNKTIRLPKLSGVQFSETVKCQDGHPLLISSGMDRQLTNHPHTSQSKQLQELSNPNNVWLCLSVCLSIWRGGG